MKLKFTSASATAMFAAVLTAACAFAQDKPKSPAAQPSPADKPPVRSDISENTLRERTIYIPYEKLRESFEKEGRGVFLPYEQFQELWRQARQSQQRPPESRPPIGAVITDIDSEAVADRDVMVVKARIKLEALGKGWHEVPLRLAEAGIRTATIGGEPARIVFDPKLGYKLLLKNDAESSRSYELALEYVRAFEKSPGLNSVRFAAPQAPINRWRIRIPQRGVKISVHPFIAAAEMGSGGTVSPAAPPTASSAEETGVMVFVGAAPEVRIEWTPKAEGATGLEALASVQAQQEVTLEEGVLRTRCRLAYEISRAELAQLVIEVPADQRVTGVFDANVRQWDVKAAADRQTVTIQLFEPAKATQNVTMELEQFSGALVMNDVRVPVIKALGVERQQGTVVVRVGEELRAEPAQRSGLVQLDAAELPQALQATSWTFAYRYATLPFELVLRTEKVKPRVRAEELVELYLEPEQATVDWLLLFDIQQAGIFQLELDVPGGYSVRRVRGQAAAGAEAAAVDSHTLEGENKTRLKVNLARKALGRVGLIVEMVRRLNDPNLAAPTGQSSTLTWPLPRTAMGLEHSQGRLVLYVPESLRITPETQTGVRPVPLAEALQGVESQRRDRFPGLRDVLTLLYTLDPVELSLSVERRKPQVNARQLLTVRVEAGVVKYDATFVFDVRYSSVKSLRIDIPTALAAAIRNVTPGIRDRVPDPLPADVAQGYTPWTFTGEREFLGEVSIRLTWEQKSQELEIGRSMDYVMPVLKPMGVDRAWGQIVISKAETLDVSAKQGFTGLRPIDPQHDLSGGARIADAARAFEFHEDWSLAITATRYQLEDVKRTSVERAVLRMVVTRGGDISVQAIYRIRSAVQRLLVSMPANRQFDSEPLRINGRAVPPERGDKNEELFVPLVNQNPDQPFVLELRYSVPGDQTRLEFPVFPAQPPVQSEPAVQKVYLVAYLPDDMALLGSQGPWTSEHKPWYGPEARTSTGPDPQSLVNWVIEGVALQNQPFESFPTDGRPHVFSTLHPVPPPAGALQLVAAKDRWLNVALFGGLALIGLVFVRQTISTKLGVLAVLVTVLVLAGVFVPTFAMQILSAPLLIGLGLVVLLWLVGAARMAASGLSPVTSGAGSSSPFTAPPAEAVVVQSPTPASGSTEPTDKTDAVVPGAPPPDAPPDSQGGRDQGGSSHG